MEGAHFSNEFGSVEGYELAGLLGADAIGEAWLASERSSGAQVVLRRVRPRDGEAWRRARRLVSVLEQFDHPGLVRLREMVPLEAELVFVYDHLEGGDLDALLAVRTVLDPGETATIASAVVDALAALPRRGLVHGDLRTASIRSTAEGRPLVADVGLGSLVDEAEPTPADDVRGLAALCYTALAGTPVDPSGAHRPLRQAAPGVPAALAHVVEAGLSERPEDRPELAAFGAQVVAAVEPTPVRLPDRPFEPVLPASPAVEPVEEIEIRPTRAA